MKMSVSVNNRVFPAMFIFLLFVLTKLHVCTCSVMFWNATQHSITLPSRFIFDEDTLSLIITANNSVFRLSLDFTSFSNLTMAGPEDEDQYSCLDRDLLPPVECQNYHHILMRPQQRSEVIIGDNVSISDTVLTCGTNAQRPRCYYRRRDTLQVIQSYQAINFCSKDQNTPITSLWTSTNTLVSASPGEQFFKFSISMSNSPYDGNVAVTTRLNDNFWIHASPHFVSMYEIGQHIYIFFREEAAEIKNSDKVIYSRVARVCKNDTGTINPILSDGDVPVFTTFIKARISCSSGSGDAGDIPFHYNDIQDTFYINSTASDGTHQQEVYAIFTSAVNGPVGSAMCVYTFNAQANDIGNVFQGMYRRRNPVDGSLVDENNYQDFSCEANSRSIEDARDIQFMKSSIRQSNGPHPLLQLPGMVFHQIVVDQVYDINRTRHDVIFITAHNTSDGNLYLLKVVGKLHSDLIDMIYLGSDEKVVQMTLRGSGADAHIYIATENGMYRVPTADCSKFTDCCSCVHYKDPYCAYDTVSHQCKAVQTTPTSATINNPLLQDILNGDVRVCYSSVGGVNPTPNPSDKSTMMKCNKQSQIPPTTVAVTTETQTFQSPSVGHFLPKKNREDHTWTIVGVVSGFIGGVVIGIILLALFYNRGNFIFANKQRTYRLRRRTSQLYEYDTSTIDRAKQNGGPLNDSLTKSRKTSGGGVATNKVEDFHKNNHESKVNSYSYSGRSNEYTPVVANGGAKFSINSNPTHGAVGDTGSVGVTLPHITREPPTPEKCASAVFNVNHKSSPSSNHSRAIQRSVQSNPNLKTNLKTEEHLTNQEREAYGHNIFIRQPSLDIKHKVANGDRTLQLHNPPLMHRTNQRQGHDFITLPDGTNTSSSQC